MIVSSDKPFSLEQIESAKELFDVYIKTVIDVEKEICVMGMDRHFEGEEILLQQGSKQHAIWGGGIDVETKEIDCNSFINIRPNDNNTSNEIQDTELRNKYMKLTQSFFKEIYDNS